MKLRIGLAIFLGSIALLRADDTIARAQQALKDQGFYYGEITGQKDTDTTAAIRRYQIRNGLHVSGDLDKETLQALVAKAPRSSQPIVTSSPLPRPQTSDETSQQNENDEKPTEAPPPQALVARPQDRQQYPSGPSAIVPSGGGLFAGTPYEMAPPEIQSNVVASAQSILAHRDLYRGEIDGIFGPGTEFSLRAYQAKIRLPVTGRLDLETLAALNLLPGRRSSIFPPRRRIIRPVPQAPVRGEWIPEH